MRGQEEKERQPGEIPRRELLKDAGSVIGGAVIGAEHPVEAVEQVYGREVYPLPGAKVAAFIYMDEARCTGCALCTYACSMKHFGVINKDAANIQVRQPQISLTFIKTNRNTLGKTVSFRPFSRSLGN